MTSGDFSGWLPYKKANNFNGILYQQGRVLSDSDGTTQTRLVNDWQHIACGDIIGRKVAAIPADEPNSFKIGSATMLQDADKRIMFDVTPGRAWVNGMIVHLQNENGDPEVTRIADYLGPPYHNVPPEVTHGSRDAVILEVYQDAINAFQLPNQLIEPALGGPDTTEMLHTSFAFRLLRLSQDDICSTIPGKLNDGDDFSNRGRLSVSLQKKPAVAGECPIDENFGYTGDTHNLYRIEIAEVKDGQQQKFKWSQFNGGLVGRGYCTTDATSIYKIRISHNMQAIVWSGLTEFYLEIITYDKEAGNWKTSYGTMATLDIEKKELILSENPIFGTAPPATADTNIFFRLWDGIRDIGEFTAHPPAMLIDGICLKFDLPAASKYHPVDHWGFKVRAGGIKMEEVLLDNSLPLGIHYQRVPLSIIEWATNPSTEGATASVIEDCRVIFEPLIGKKGDGGCCSISVGDGVSSHGDYDSLQDAINSIGQMGGGGEICLLDGIHHANVIINGKNNLVVRGCGSRTKVVNNEGKSPIITIQNSNKIVIQDIEFVADKAVAIRIERTEAGIVKEIKVQDNTIHSIGNPESIKALVEVFNGIDIIISGNNIVLQEGKGAETGIYISGTNITVAKNIISAQFFTEGGVGGGLQIGNGSQNIDILENNIVGGSGNGITLGDRIQQEQITVPFIYKISIDGNEISRMGVSGIGVPRLLPSSSSSPNNEPFQLTSVLAMGTPILDIQICGNKISNCLQRPFDKNMILETGLALEGMPCRGFGGILLTWCEKVIIKDNKIEDNGRQHIDPVCGIFIFYLSEGQIIQNYIFNNGRIGQGGGGTESFNNGPRGGVMLIFSTGRNVISEGNFFGEDFATRVHDNVISQPVGRALLIGAQGMISVVNNYFTSDLQDPFTQLGFPGGCVSIFNPGMIRNSNVTNTGSNTMNIGAPQLIGGVIFENNQSRLGQLNKSTISHYIITESDLCFGSNQINCLNPDLRINTFLRASSVRACENRFKETRTDNTLSLSSMGTLMNITANNQGDHCIIAMKASTSPIPVVNTGNLVLNSSDCQNLHNSIFSKAVEVERPFE